MLLLDGSLMAAHDVVARLSKHAGLLLGSSELQPAHGWDYNVSLAMLAAEPTASALQLATSLADGCVASPCVYRNLPVFAQGEAFGCSRLL